VLCLLAGYAGKLSQRCYNMNTDNALVNSEYVEYLIIGSQTCTWLILLFAWLLGIPLARLGQVNPLLLVVVLPFAYSIGIIMDRLSYLILMKTRRLVTYGLGRSTCKDEWIAFRSETLYAAYEWRIRRIRIPGATALNWPPLGGVLVLYLGLNSFDSRVVEFSTLALTVVSLLAWMSLYRRAYQFRQNACDVIAENANSPISTRVHEL
jgi:hypothetical protein